MFFTEETYAAVILEVIQQQEGWAEDIGAAIEETVGALIAADRKLRAYDTECYSSTSEIPQPGSGTGS